MKKIYRVFFLPLCCIVFLWSGCQDNQSMNNNTNNSATKGSTNEPTKLITKEEMVKQIEQKYNGKVTDIEIEPASIYEIELIVGTEKRKLIVNGTTGEVMSDKVDGKVGTVQTPSKQVAITKEKAEEIALKQSGGGYLLKNELDMDATMSVYEVKIVHGNNKYEYEIDANTGKIVKSKQE